MKFALVALLGFAAAEEDACADVDCEDDANAENDCCVEEEEEDACAEVDCEDEANAENDCCAEEEDNSETEGGEEEAGSAVVPIILVLAAIGGLAGTFYCHKTKKACFAPKDGAGGEGGHKETLI